MHAAVTRLAVTLCSCAWLVAATQPAAAVTTLERPEMYFTFDPGATSLELCATGNLRDQPAETPVWTLDINGVRATTSPSDVVFSGNAWTPTQGAFLCLTVAKNGALAGTYTARFRYDNLPTDPPSIIAAQVAWFPGSDGEIVSIDQ